MVFYINGKVASEEFGHERVVVLIDRFSPLRIAPVCAIMLLFASMPIFGFAAQYGARQLADINPNGDADPWEFRRLNDSIVFEAFDGESRRLFSSDGTSVTRIDFGDVVAPNPELVYTTGVDFRGPLPAFKNSLYFVADGAEGRSLYKTDGQVATEVASGVAGMLDYDIYLPPFASPTDDYLKSR